MNVGHRVPYEGNVKPFPPFTLKNIVNGILRNEQAERGEQYARN